MRYDPNTLVSSERLHRGYVIILPGIEGRSWLNRRIARGLLSAGIPYGIEIYDWTRRWPWLLYNLRSRRLHTEQAELIAAKILAYQHAWPHRPVYLVGHSGGGAMTLKALEALPQSRSVAGAVLLGAAISPGYNIRPALGHVELGLWNFTSRADAFFLGVFTTVAGTLDGRHSPSAGMLGFRPRELEPHERARFEEIPFRPEFLADFNWAGHFGFTAVPFVRNHVAPLLMTEPRRASETEAPLSLLTTAVAHAPLS